MNLTVIKGRLVRDVETFITQNEKTIGKFSIAVSDRFNKEKTHFFNCVSFGNLAENISKYFQKGKEILISGSLSQNKYTTKDGVSKSDIQIIVNSFDFCGYKSEVKNEETQKDNSTEIEFPDFDESGDIPF